ncbi:two pore domain potassium channel family protein [Phaeobacter inhibens]|uniref:ion channel n=1 Tax=Phaeobacter inhibens TaxID=221822 RepID=UPI00016332F4|nr:ion channel [Phaeobacter inhibens]AUQ44555.1 putative ion channel protein [Phaeobacter inhibens]AXT21478.1 two pore domain potassium channel family protein [Phaeobacter inhibens]UWR91948.1 potassium channel family protein [Phaeobacter inhibens]
MNFLFPRKTSTIGSNLRKMWTIASVAVSIVIFLEAFNPVFDGTRPFLEKTAISVLTLWSTAYFVLVVATVPFLTSHDFWPNPTRLATDALVSITQTIFVFALVYRTYGIVGPTSETTASAWDHLYFSAVTFSTLGYGDFRPDIAARGFAAFQSIVGNLHLGMIVGVAFFAAQPERSDNHGNNNATNNE